MLMGISAIKWCFIFPLCLSGASELPVEIRKPQYCVFFFTYMLYVALPTNTQNTFKLLLVHNWVFHLQKHPLCAPNTTFEGSIACYHLLPCRQHLLSLSWCWLLCQTWDFFISSPNWKVNNSESLLHW